MWEGSVLLWFLHHVSSLLQYLTIQVFDTSNLQSSNIPPLCYYPNTLFSPSLTIPHTPSLHWLKSGRITKIKYNEKSSQHWYYNPATVCLEVFHTYRWYLISHSSLFIYMMLVSIQCWLLFSQTENLSWSGSCLVVQSLRFLCSLV